MIDKARQIALIVLYRIDKEEAYSNIALDEEINKNRNKLTDKDIGFISEIVYGTTIWRLTIDTIISKYSKLKIKKLSKWILNILRMGIYQIIFLDKIPKSAAVNESVTLAKRYGHAASANMVNAILRKITKEDYESLFQIEDSVERMVQTTSMPRWIVEELLKEKNLQEVEQICKALYQRPKIAIRVNTLKTTKTQLKQQLIEKGMQVTDGILGDFLIVEKMKAIEKLTLFQEGKCTIQDEAAGLAAYVLQPSPGDNVLDACSAPGGKTTYLAQLMQDKGQIEAWDIHEHRTRLVMETAQRLGIHIINVKVKDATTTQENQLLFDKILLDVPCSGTGVIRRKPDIKWRHHKEEIDEITKVQKQILQNCSELLKKGGELVYSTCSILQQENEKIIEQFVEKNRNFEILKPNIAKQNTFYPYQEKAGYIKVFPNQHTDGFFICKLKKI